MLLLLALPMLALLFLPLLSLLARVRVPLLIENLRTTEVVQAVSLSLITSATSTAAAIVLGVPLVIYIGLEMELGTALTLLPGLRPVPNAQIGNRLRRQRNRLSRQY